MENITIATFNWQNKFKIFWNKEENDECKIFIDFIVKNDIDFIGIQELTKRKIKHLLPLLKKYNYDIYEEGRFGKLGLIFPLSLFNETNAIIYKKRALERAEILKLPLLGAEFPRIITKGVFENIIFLNTHLDRRKIKAKQLNKIYDEITKAMNSDIEIILTGDFNMTLHNKNFLEFIKKLEKLNLKRVEANANSCNKVDKGPIDHIFIPKNWQILEIKQNNLNISDHNIIVVKIKNSSIR